MKERIYKFLDEYVGEGTNWTLRHQDLFRTWSDSYEFVSNNGTMILWFSIRHDNVKVFRSEELCRKIEGYFNVPSDESWKYIRDWFGQRNNIKVLSDLLKIIAK